MKYLLYLLLLVSTTIYSQAKLEVKIHDVCGEANEFRVKIQLFEGGNLISESNEAHHTFDGLNPDGNYTIKVKATPITIDNYGVKDVVLIQNHILGINPLNRLGSFAGDINLDSKVTASDIVTLKKNILDISNDSTLEKLFILDTINNPFYYPLESEVYYINGIKNNHHILDLTVVNVGHVAESSGLYCDEKCSDINDKHAQILFDDQNVNKGTTVDVSFYLKNEFNYRALDFTFNVTNAKIVSIDPLFDCYKRDQNQIHALWTNNNFGNIVSPQNSVFNFTIQPDQDGKLSDFIIFEANNPNNEAVIRDGNCIRSIKKLALISSKDFVDQCDIIWPKDITISNCQDHTGEPQISQICQNVVDVKYFDNHIDQCKKIERYWELKNWVSGEVFKHTQHIIVDENFDHICLQNVQVNFTQDSTKIKASNFVFNANPDHQYSFTSSVVDSIRILRYEYPRTFQVDVYDLTTSKVCVAGLVKNFVDLDSFIVISHIISRQVNGNYKVSATDFSLSGTNLPANIKDVLISYDGSNFVSEYNFDQSKSGHTIDFNLKYTKNETIINHGVVTVYFEPNTFVENVDPLELFTYNDYLLPDKEYNIDIYSTNFQKILSFQYGALIKNAKLRGVKDGALKVTNSYSYMTDLDMLRMLWFDEAVMPKTIDQNTILFTLTLMPDEAGYVADFISLNENILNAEAAFEGNVISGKIHLNFGFKTRTSRTENQVTSDQIDIYPNPLIDNILNISWPSDFNPSHMVISDVSGKIMLQKSDIKWSHQPMTIQVDDSWPKGIYFIIINDDLRILSKKIAITN